MDNKDLSIVAALAKSVGGGGGSSTPIPTPTAEDVGKVPKVNEDGEYELAIDEGQSTFAGLTDTTITSPANGQVPVYNSTTNKWENKDSLPLIVERTDSTTFSVDGDTIISAMQSGRGVVLKDTYDGGKIYVASNMSTSGPTTFVRFMSSLTSIVNLVIFQGGFINIGTTALYVDLTGTLVAGQTTITFNDNKITTDSTIQVFTNTGVDYTAISVSTGSVTITYPSQQADVNVKVRVS